MTAVLSCRFPLGRNPDISPMSHLREPLRVRNPSKPYKPCCRELARSSVMTVHQQNRASLTYLHTLSGG